MRAISGERGGKRAPFFPPSFLNRGTNRAPDQEEEGEKIEEKSAAPRLHFGFAVTIRRRKRREVPPHPHPQNFSPLLSEWEICCVAVVHIRILGRRLQCGMKKVEEEQPP